MLFYLLHLPTCFPPLPFTDLPLPPPYFLLPYYPQPLPCWLPFSVLLHLLYPHTFVVPLPSSLLSFFGFSYTSRLWNFLFFCFYTTSRLVFLPCSKSPRNPYFKTVFYPLLFLIPLYYFLIFSSLAWCSLLPPPLLRLTIIILSSALPMSYVKMFSSSFFQSHSSFPSLFLPLLASNSRFYLLKHTCLSFLSLPVCLISFLPTFLYASVINSFQTIIFSSVTQLQIPFLHSSVH